MSAATELFASRGYAEVTSDDVAVAAGVPVGEVTRLFPQPPDLLQAVCADPLNDLDLLADQVLAAAADAIDSRVVRLLEGYVRICVKHRAALPLAVDEDVLSDPDVRARRQVLRERLGGVLRAHGPGRDDLYLRALIAISGVPFAVRRFPTADAAWLQRAVLDATRPLIGGATRPTR